MSAVYFVVCCTMIYCLEYSAKYFMHVSILTNPKKV